VHAEPDGRLAGRDEKGQSPWQSSNKQMLRANMCSSAAMSLVEG